MSMEAALQTYFTEAHELLEQMERLLLQFESGQVSDEADDLNAIFRAAHTIKGSAGIFGLDSIVDFTHVVENLLDKLRSGDIVLTPQLITLLLHSHDHIALLLDAVERSTEAENNPRANNGIESTEGLSQQAQQQGDNLIQNLLQCLNDETVKAQGTIEQSEYSVPQVARELAEPIQPEADMVERLAVEVENDFWHLSVRFGENSFRDGMDPLSFIQFLATLGRVSHILTLSDNLPTLDSFEAESCYLGFEIQLSSKASKQEIEDVFEFMREDGFLRILPPHSAIGAYIEMIDTMPEADLYLGEILIQCGALTRGELAAALRLQAQAHPDRKPLGEMLVEQDQRLKPLMKAVLNKQTQMRESLVREQTSLRVDADKLDTLINQVGELVTAGSGTVMQAEALGNSQMIESVAILNSLLEEVRDTALKLRMVPIGVTFSKFQRVVRDTANDLSKEVELVISGADTELDKSVVEKIGDPLMHLVRNALDHGIESPATRIAQGKPAQGQLTLNAFHDSGDIVIEISDDGKGLDPEMLRVKAIEKGLIVEDAVLSKDELLNLIFEPGFSTVDSISNLSGRGVGMDVVKRNITELRGRIEMNSEVGVGTTLRIILPLTLAIIDGFLIGVGNDSFVVPLNLVQECVELDSRYLRLENNVPYINLRNEVLPLINLHRHFGLKGKPTGRQNIVVVKANGQMCGLVVNKLLGEFQTVIKPLGRVFERVSGLSGSTILGNGAVALILDVQGLVQSLAIGSVPSIEKNLLIKTEGV
ncbi:MAG: two-component system chemotaxis sensor kinase CheA [Oleispira sp.]|jgi:two-component system chemotaxis sensor kinase CheA